MGYPQPNSNAPVLAGQGFFRLTTPIVSSGDMYESLQAGAAFALGPNSDIANVNISYFDETNSPTFLSTTLISPQRHFVGNLYARNDSGAKYQPSGRPGRVLIYPDDIWNPNYVPINFSVGNADALFLYNPILDVVQYLSAPATLVPARSDRSYQLQALPQPSASQTFWFVFPCYGRSYIDMQFTNRTNPAITLSMLGVTLTINKVGSGDVSQETTLVSSTSIARDSSSSKVVKSSTDGMFDLIVCSFQPAALQVTEIAFRLMMSDTPR